MRRGRDWMQHLAEELRMGETPLPGVSLVELSGDGRVLIENHFGITQYGKERICIKVSFGCVEICGCNLILSRMTPGQLVVRGRILSITLHRRDSNG